MPLLLDSQGEALSREQIQLHGSDEMGCGILQKTVIRGSFSNSCEFHLVLGFLSVLCIFFWQTFSTAKMMKLSPKPWG